MERIRVLGRFARLASEVESGHAILPLLADMIVEHVGATAVAIVEIGAGGATVIPSVHTPSEIVGLKIDPDGMGSELIDHLLHRCATHFSSAITRPLVAGGGLFGSVLMLFDGPADSDKLTLADGLIDIAATALESLTRVRQLAESHAVVRAREEALAKGEKLRALGQMASGVSHDLKNILNPLSGYLQLTERALKNGGMEDAQLFIAKARQSLVRGTQTVERLRDFGRDSSVARPEPVDLNQLVKEAADIARPRMSAPTRVLCAIELELGSPRAIMGRAGDIVSALVNLMVNAIDAMPSGGTLTLRTGNEGGSTWVEVADTGPGMSPEVQARVFEPFFTTKGDEGTGLGLAMVQACMQRHGGSVTLDTAAGKGTRFALSFPHV